MSIAALFYTHKVNQYKGQEPEEWKKELQGIAQLNGITDKEFEEFFGVKKKNNSKT